MVQIRKLQLDDADILSQLMNNINIWNNLRDRIPFPYSRKDALTFIKLSHTNDHLHNFAITYQNNFCGVIGFVRQTDIHKLSVELGYWIGEPYWHKGIATRSIQLATEWAFRNLDIIRIFASVFEHNHGSMKALLKNNYQREAILKKAVLKNGQILDEHIFAKLR